MTFDRRPTADRAAARATADTGLCVGKHTRVSQLEVAAVQRSATGGEPAGTADVHAAAARGTATPTTALPHAERIQSLFGPAHDVSTIQAHVGGDSASAMGAAAYATGNHVVFDRAPDLHTAAHEAAHVVQQARGVNLLGGVGEAGDAYERHADAVADRVVAGQSAAALLASGPGGGATASAVQRSPSEAQQDAAVAKHKAEDARHVVFRLADAALYGAYLDLAGAWYDAPISVIARAIHGYRKGESFIGIPGHERLEMFEWGLGQLAPVLAAAKKDPELRDKLAQEIEPRLSKVRQILLVDDASDRSEHPELNKAKQPAAAPGAGHPLEPREQGSRLAAMIPGLIKTTKDMTDRVKTAGEVMVKGHMSHAAEHGLEHLGQFGHTLELLGGLLKLGDKEFQEELAHPKTVMNGIASYSELVKTSIETSSATVTLTADFAAAMAKLAGNEVAAEALENAVKRAAPVFENVIAAFEILHGAATMMDSSATRQQRIDGGAELAMGTAGVIGSAVFGSAGLATMTVAGPYYMAKIAASLYNEAVEGWETGFVRDGLMPFLRDQGHAIASVSAKLSEAGVMSKDKSKPDEAAAFAEIERREGRRLGGMIDNFLDRCDPSAGNGMGSEFKQHDPANYTIVAEKLRPLLGLRGAKTGAQASAAAAEVLNAIRWVVQHVGGIIKASAHQENLAGMEKMEAKDAEAAKEKKEE